MRSQLDATSERLSGFSEVSVSPAHAEHILRELSGHEDKACVRHTHKTQRRKHIVMALVHHAVNYVINVMTCSIPRSGGGHLGTDVWMGPMWLHLPHLFLCQLCSMSGMYQ